MKFTLSWLKNFLETNEDIHSISHALTSIGLEIEDIIDRSDELKDFEIAQIIDAKPHPKADKLHVCQVQSKDKILEIVCGAPNARAGIKVVLAKIGSVIPCNNLIIKETEIRGIKSCGMLASESELMIGDDSDGIIELPEDSRIGDSIIQYYGLNDPVIHVNITPNRGDALGVYGIARDLAAKGIGTLKAINIPDIAYNFESKFPITVKANNLCPIFCAVEIRNLKNVESPFWLKYLLEKIGIKSVSAIVDITNYIAYSFGQPMHAYDADKIDSLQVNTLDSNIKFNALNDKEYNLLSGDLVITNDQSIECLAGIIGSKNSSCSLDTKRIILESALFDPDAISNTGMRLQIHTDSRYRFERKIDPQFCQNALAIAIDLIVNICNADLSNTDRIEVSQPIIIKSTNYIHNNLKISFDFIKNQIGFEISQDKIISILQKLGFKPEADKDALNIIIPSWRNDINIKQDIVEEILRIYGYDVIPKIPLPNMNISRVLDRNQSRIFDIGRIMANIGYDEVLTWSFMSNTTAKLFSDIDDNLFLANPISDDLDYMRPNIIPNLLNIVFKNQLRSITDISIFESGPVFYNHKNEMQFICCVRSGFNCRRNPHENRRLFDIFDIKSDLSVIMDYIGIPLDRCQLVNTQMRYYHPTRSASINLGKNVLGYIGQIHPKILAHFNIKQNVFAFELNLDNIPLSKPKFGKCQAYVKSDFQNNIRDFAFVVDKKIKVSEIIACIKNTNKKLIKNVELFDVYSGEQLGLQEKSIAFSVNIQSDVKTLTEEELQSISDEIISNVKLKFHAILR
ncbi:MAG: phenylalanine--tRNA ligase subunit beta [Rickettsiaceae bacterium]